MKKAFTLAEVLITLGIIGVVAAMTIPILLQNYSEKRTVSILRETQSIIAQSMKMAEEEYGDMEGWFTKDDDFGSRALKISQNLKPFMKLALDCGNTADTKEKCIINANYLEKNGHKRMNYVQEDRAYAVSLLNGSSVWWIQDNNKRAQFYIDTNGKYPPNTWGKDLFMFEYSNNSLRPMGAPDSNWSYKTNCITKDSTGVGCAYYVLTQQNMNYLH